MLFREQTKNIDMNKISRDIYEAEKAQSKANDDLETASGDKDMAKDRLREVKIDKYKTF